jgi:C-terminal processing protease CtpA/Prc
LHPNQECPATITPDSKLETDTALKDGNVGPKRCIFVVSERSNIPLVALALQAAGSGIIVSEGEVTDQEEVTTTTIQLPDGLQARVRLAELIYSDGSSGVAPNIEVAAGAGVPAALALAAKPSDSKQVERLRVPILTARQPTPRYPDTQYPAAAYRALGALQIWASHSYFYPYKALMNPDWDGVLKVYLPKFEAATDEREYHLEVAEMLTHVHDTHSGASSKVLEQFFGEAPPWLRLRWIENAPVVAFIVDKKASEKAGIHQGDTIVQFAGAAVETRIRELSRYLSASTPQALMWKVCRTLLNGPAGSDVSVQVRKPDGRLLTATVSRKLEYRIQVWPATSGDVVDMLPDNIGYVDLNRLTTSMVDDIFEKFRSTRAIILDMRGYPQATAWAIAPRLTDVKSPIAALFSRPVALGPEPGPGELAETATYAFTQPLPATEKWRYKGQTIMLIDERTISQAEHTGLFFEAANGTKFVGTPTSGANGDVTEFSVPGGIQVRMTGHEVRHADGRQLQRIGLQPDVLVAPTIKGLAAGRDEVLDSAVEFIKSGK